MSETVTLTLTREHTQVVQDACELLMRLKLGQTFFATELLLGWPEHEGMDTHEYCLLRDIANDILRGYLKAVGCPEGTPKDLKEHIAYEVWGTLRHAFWKHENPGVTDSWDVRSQEPLSESGLRMPMCEVKEG